MGEGQLSSAVAEEPTRTAESGLPDVCCTLAQPGRPPLFIQPLSGKLRDLDAAIVWMRDHRPVLDRLIVEHGGIVLRGFPLQTAEDFDRASGVFPPYRQGYLGGNSPREVVLGKVLESTRMDAKLRLPVHSEMAYMRVWPPRIAFFCVTPAPLGGETIIADLRAVSRRLPASVREKVAKLGIRIVRNYAPPVDELAQKIDHPDAVPWNKALQTHDRAEVERNCERLGMEPIWNDGDSLTLVTQVEAFAMHPVTGQSIYRSTIHHAGRTYSEQPFSARQALPTGMTLGDGSRLTDEEIEQVNAILDEETLHWPWRAGDLMILDNLQIAHGRNPYEGQRETLVTLLD
jgi:hypothetical protein